jgi:hypothetical protein
MRTLDTLILPRIAQRRKCAMSKKKESRKKKVPAIPQLSLEALDDVQKIERYARQQLRECENLSHFNTQKAERILRTCTVQVLKAQIAYYESLPTFHEKWIIKLQENTIESAVGMIPGGYGNDLEEHFRDVLWKTTYADLNPPKTLTDKKEESRKPDATLPEQIKKLRDEARLTNEELADEINLEPRSLYRHLSGTPPRARHIAAYEKVFSEKLARKILLQNVIKTSGKRHVKSRRHPNAR